MKVIASENGKAALGGAFELLQNGGSAVDACLAVTTHVEDDPTDITVGYGGLPNELGIVELDAAVMDGARHRAGAVAALQNIRNPTQVAKLVMNLTERVLIAGEGARQFATKNGFREENLLSENARRVLVLWQRLRDQGDSWCPPKDDDPDFDLFQQYREVFHKPPKGTVYVSAIDRHGNIASATSTSGHAFKLPGRVGDSPIVGAGLYADNETGSCGSVGRGETNMENLTSYAAVQHLSRGQSPSDAGLAALRGLKQKTPAQRKDAAGKLTIDVRLFVLSIDGRHAGVCTSGNQWLSVVDESGTRVEDCQLLE